MSNESSPLQSVCPQITLPFPVRINPFSTSLGDCLTRSATAAGVLSPSMGVEWSAARYERLVARMYPFAPLSTLTLVGEAVLWLFLLDDHLDPGGAGSDPDHAWQVVRRAMQVLDGCEQPAEPVVLLWLWRWRERVVCRAPSEWWRHCVKDLIEFAESLYHETSARSRGWLPGMGEYLEARRWTSGWVVLTDLIEFAGNTVLPADVRDSTQYAHMRWAAGDVACAVNDLFSLRKEIKAGEIHNLVLVLQRSEQCTLSDAVDRTIEWMTTRLGDYFQAREEFLAQDSPTKQDFLMRHVVGIESLMRGSLDWSVETGRYQCPLSPPSEAQQGAVS
jgi:Terpene synthase family 2, C-terminal metal binding